LFGPQSELLGDIKFKNDQALCPKISTGASKKT